MKFAVKIEGDFTNVEGCRLIQRYELEMQCGKCGAMKKGVRINEEKTFEEKFDAKKDPAHYNVIMKCECDTEINIKISEPEDYIVVTDKNGEYPRRMHPVLNGKCHVTNIWSDGGVLLGIDNVQLTLAAKTHEIYENVDISKRVVAEQKEGETCFIENFNLKVEQIN